MKTANPLAISNSRATPRNALSNRPATLEPQRLPVRMTLVPVRSAYAAKGWLDYLLALAIVIPALPVMVVCMLLVKMTSRGPAVYSQTRVGRGGRIFTIYKIRSMYHECEKLTGIQWCVKGDRRVTPVGRVLRALHLDELPQLWNVLNGDMSLIGPRPERPEIVDDLRVTLGERQVEQDAGASAREAQAPGPEGPLGRLARPGPAPGGAVAGGLVPRARLTLPPARRPAKPVR